jgi:ABC-type dipeptide/oligopeptide/nickel transport system permease subunit
VTQAETVDARPQAEVFDEQIEEGAKPLGLWSDTWRRLKRNKLALIGLGIIIVFITIGTVEEIAFMFGKPLTPYPPNEVNYALSPQGLGSPPSLKHPFGTDYLGRDVFSRVLEATSIDIFFAFPYILFVLLIMSVLGAGFQNVFIAIGILGWATFARIVRGQILSVKSMEFVEAARAQGASDLRIIFRHVLPNSMAPVYVAVAMAIGGAIATEAALSYLGIGVQPPTPSWGLMIADAVNYLTGGNWWYLFFPSLALVLTVFGFISFGNGLRDATDPKLKE